MKIYKSIAIKEVNSDFTVDEVPSLPPHVLAEPTNSKYKYTILHVEKSSFTTFEVIDILATNLRIDREGVNCLGLKDEDGITRQFISVKKELKQDDLDNLNEIYNNKNRYINSRLQGYSKEPLQEKKLHGNVFGVTLRVFTKSEAYKLHDSIKKSSEHIFVNYYDQQRFGLPGGPFVSHKIGEAIVEDHKDQALKFYIMSGNAKIDGYHEGSLTTDVFSKLNPKKIDFFVSAYTSYLWNKQQAQSLAKSEGARHIDIFDGYTLPCSPKDAAAVASISKVQGFKYSRTGGVEVYIKARESVIGTKVYTGAVKPDNLNKGKFKLRLEFFLPTGCYATMAVKQLLATRI